MGFTAAVRESHCQKVEKLELFTDGETKVKVSLKKGVGPHRLPWYGRHGNTGERKSCSSPSLPVLRALLLLIFALPPTKETKLIVISPPPPPCLSCGAERLPSGGVGLCHK